MANISAIKLPSGNTYDLVDKTSGYVTTDEKLVVNQENSNNTYYPIISTSSTAASTKYIDTRGIKLDITNGTERSQGDITLVLGNSTAVNYDGNKAGFLQLYGPYSRYVQIQTPSSFTSDVYLTLPSSTGTLALTSNIKDATLTIQKNGVNVETFSANASSNKTANIVVNEVPSGGITGQVLAKNSGTNYDVGWITLPDNGAYIVTFIYDDENETWSCDKTAQEIYEARESGMVVIGKQAGESADPSMVLYLAAAYRETGTDNYYELEFRSQTALYPNHFQISERGFFYSSSGEIEYEGGDLSVVPSARKINNKPLYSDITLTASDVGAQEPLVSGTNIKTINNNSILGSGDLNISVPTKTSDLTNDSGFITGMTILSYGSSTWQNFIDAYNASKVVYCRASSSANPASGSQTRLAFMAYVNNAATPTEVEFQYYRSVSTHTASQQGDQVYVYKLNKTNGWSVTTREASVKVVAGTGLSGTYSNGTMTLTAPHDTTKQDTLVSGTNIKTINNESLLGSGNITVSAEAGIFVCEYGVTTFADALVAHNAGKRLVCHYNNSLLDFYAWLEAYDSENTYFEFEVTSGDKHMEFYLDSSGWTRGEYPASAIPIARRISKFNSDSRMNSTDMTSSQVDDFVDALNVTGTSVKWSQLKSETISSSSQRVDISSYIGQYDELLFMCRNVSSQRHTPPILIPTIAISNWGNSTYYFEGGSYATPSAYNAIKLLINKSGTTVKFGVDWDMFEGTAYNTVVTVYGK